MITDLGRLTEDWSKVESIVLYGAGTVSKICENLFSKIDIKIECVIDRDPEKQGKEWNGITIVSFESIKDRIHEYKIVVMAAHTAFNSISSILEKEGLKEFEDYCRVGQFISEWLWNEKGLNCVYHVDMTVTTRCTLNCRHCNMFIPYYKERRDYSFDELRSNIDLFFARIDYVAYFGLIGGEPMMNPSLVDVIEYLENKYSSQFGRISYASNGTIIPEDNLLEVMKKYGVHIVVSDYSDIIPYSEKILKIKDRFEAFGVDYDIKPTIEWCDFGFPERPVVRDNETLKVHLMACRPEWNGLNDGKFYYCNVSWSAEKSGRFLLDKTDYIVLKDIDPNDRIACHKISELSRGTSTFCRICGGCGIDNKQFVKTGVQL